MMNAIKSTLAMALIAVSTHSLAQVVYIPNFPSDYSEKNVTQPKAETHSENDTAKSVA